MELTEDLNQFRCEIDVDDPDQITAAISKFSQIQSLFDEEELNFAILNHGETISSDIPTLNELEINVIEDIQNQDSTDKFSIKISCYKSSINRFPVYCFNQIMNNIPVNIASALSQWNIHLSKHLTIKTVEGVRNIKNVQLHESINKYSLPDIIKNTDLLPECFDSIVTGPDSISQYFSKFTSQFCLSALASSITDEEDSRNIYSFEGYAKVDLETKFDEEYIERLESILAVYQWVFIDNNYNTRLGILRNVMSIKSSKSFVELFDNDLLRILQSNYKIYLKDNIKQYIEVKNKTAEFMFELQKKAGDIVEDYKTTLNKLILGIITYFFTVAMVKIFNKSETTIMTTEVTIITSVLLVFSMFYLFFCSKDLERRKTQLASQLVSIKKQYKNVIDEKELDDIFSKKLISDIADDFSMVFKAGFWMLMLAILLIATIFTSLINNYF
jgi:hypothetical protein